MLKDRTFLVKSVKDQDLKMSDPSPPVDYNKITETIAKNLVIVIAAYMGGDTLRQILVHVAKTGIQAE